MAAAASPFPHDHSCDWVHELQRLTATADSLPRPACLAVLAAIDAFYAEDGRLPPAALEARNLLTATLVEPRITTPGFPSLAETLLEALKQRGQNAPPLRQAHAA